MRSVSKDNSYKLFGIGVIMNEGAIDSTTGSEKLNIRSIILQSRKLTLLPAVLMHSFSVIELTIKMVFKAINLKPKVIHCHDTLVLPLGVIVKLFTGAQLIYDTHELESDRNGLSKTLGRITLFVEKLLWRSLDALIVVSPSIERWYKDNIGKKYSKIILNAPIVSESDFNYDKSYLREKFSIHPDSKIFIYIGILGKGRGIELIIEAFKNNDINSSLVFLGYGELADDLRGLASRYSNIYLHDAVPHAQVTAIAKSANVGLCLIQNVSLSDYYCLPNKLFEYTFSEISVLASNFPDISQLVQKYNLGKCTELSSESIYRAIKEFESLKLLPKIDLENLYDLTWEAQEEKILKLYEEILED
jgi:glycosyltransferase involved in cell wall biosynthesis